MTTVSVVTCQHERRPSSNVTPSLTAVIFNASVFEAHGYTHTYFLIINP